MARNSTVFKVYLSIADIDRGYFHNHALILARHPSESDQRMMLRVLAFSLNAHPELEFGKGVSTREEPDLWRKNKSGDIEHWIDLGQPSEKRIRQACIRSSRVDIFAYRRQRAASWWQQLGNTARQYSNLRVRYASEETLDQLVPLIARNMDLHCTLEDNNFWFGSKSQTENIFLETWL